MRPLRGLVQHCQECARYSTARKFRCHALTSVLLMPLRNRTTVPRNIVIVHSPPAGIRCYLQQLLLESSSSSHLLRPTENPDKRRILGQWRMDFPHATPPVVTYLFIAEKECSRYLSAPRIRVCMEMCGLPMSPLFDRNKPSFLFCFFIHSRISWA